MPVIAHDPSGLRFVLRVRGLQTAHVALELLDDAEQIVRDRRRLRRLRVRVRGEQRGPVLRREIDQTGPELEHRLDQRAHELPLPHAIHRHVDVVAAAGGVESAGDVLATGADENALDVEEEVLAGAVVRRAPDVVDRDGVERVADGPGIGRGHDAAVGEHDEVRVVNRQQRREEQRLRILEVLVEDLRDVFRIEPHEREYSAARSGRGRAAGFFGDAPSALRHVDAKTADDVARQIGGQERTADVLAHAEPRVEDFHRQLLGDRVGHPQRAHHPAVMRDVRGAEVRARPA